MPLCNRTAFSRFISFRLAIINITVVNQLCIMLVTSSEEQSGIAPVEVDATGYVYQVFFLKVIGAGFTRLAVRFLP